MSTVSPDQFPSRMFTSDYLQKVYNEARSNLDRLSIYTSGITSIVKKVQENLGNSVEIISRSFVFPRENGHRTFDGYYTRGLATASDYRQLIPQSAVRDYIHVTRPDQGTRTTHVVTTAWRPVVTLIDISQHENSQVVDGTYKHEYLIVNPHTSRWIFNHWISDVHVQYQTSDVYKPRLNKTYAAIVNTEISCGKTGFYYGESDNLDSFLLSEGLEDWDGNVSIQ